MSNDRFDDVISLLKANDEARGWTPDPSAAFTRLAKDHPELATAPPAEPSAVVHPDALEVSIGELTVIHRADPPAPRPRRRDLWALSAAAAVVLIGAASVIVSESETGGSAGRTQLRTVTPTAPIPASSAGPSTPALSTPALTHPSVAGPASVPGSSKTSTPSLVAPAPLTAQIAVSRSTLHPGQSLVVTYTWDDGDGTLLDVNRVESTAVKVIRPRPCQQRTHVPHPSRGSASYVFTFTYPLPTGGLLAGIHVPFDHPEQIPVGVQIHTGGNCAPDEIVTVTQLVTLVPPPASATSPTADVSPTPSTSPS